MSKFRKKPVEIEAIQFIDTAERLVELSEWVGEQLTVDYSVSQTHPTIKIHTLEGVMRADYGDWIIKGVNGEFYPCKPDIFEKTYEAVE